MIGILNTGFGNINSIKNIYYEYQIPCTIVEGKNDIAGLSKIILPGIGSFDTLIEKINKMEIVSELNNFVLYEKKPVLGICIGMQIFFERSDEGKNKGFGWINGKIEKLDIKGVRLPHMGWNKVFNTKENPLFKNIKDGSSFYFLHSYANTYNEINCMDGTVFTNYGKKFVSAICQNNIFGVQFHPEKSHKNGIQLLLNFSKLND